MTCQSCCLTFKHIFKALSQGSTAPKDFFPSVPNAEFMQPQFLQTRCKVHVLKPGAVYTKKLGQTSACHQEYFLYTEYKYPG